MSKSDKVFSFMLDYTTRNMRRYATETFAIEGLGITVDQWGVLLLLRDNDRELSVTELAAGMVKDKPTTTRIIDVLVRESLVVRRQDEHDRRSQRVSLTAKGEEVAKKAQPVVDRLRDEVGSCLTKRQRKALLEYLNRLNERIDMLRKQAANQVGDGSGSIR